MADITQTAANVAKDASRASTTKKAGEAIEAGMAVYKKTADGEYYKAINSSAAAAAAVGIAINSAPGANQPIEIQDVNGSSITLGGTLVIGTIYCVSNTAGKICPSTDIGAAEFVTVLGIATTAALLKLGICASGVAVPT